MASITILVAAAAVVAPDKAAPMASLRTTML
jgi:hypothetical protein